MAVSDTLCILRRCGPQCRTTALNVQTQCKNPCYPTLTRHVMHLEHNNVKRHTHCSTHWMQKVKVHDHVHDIVNYSCYADLILLKNALIMILTCSSLCIFCPCDCHLHLPFWEFLWSVKYLNWNLLTACYTWLTTHFKVLLTMITETCVVWSHAWHVIMICVPANGHLPHLTYTWCL